MSSDSRRTSRCFSWMSLNQSTSMSSSRPSASQMLAEAWLAAPPSSAAPGRKAPAAPAHPPAPPAPHRRPRLSASLPVGPRGAPGHLAAAQWHPSPHRCPPQERTGLPGPANGTLVTGRTAGPPTPLLPSSSPLLPYSELCPSSRLALTMQAPGTWCCPISSVERK